MKLTAKNLLENWDNVKGQLSDRIVKAYEAGVPDALPYYDDPEFAEIVDMFLKDANEELAEAEKKADKNPKPKTITAEERKRRAQKIKEHRKDRNNKPETPAECEDMHAYLEIKKQNSDKFLSVKRGDFLEVYGQDAKELADITGYTLTKTSKFKNTEGKSLSLVAFPYADFNKVIQAITKLGFKMLVLDESNKPIKATKPQTKTEKMETKKTKTEKKTANHPHKDSYARAPYWYKILEGFTALAGKNKETWRIQNYLDFIQDSCAAERNRKTPFIELIRKIQDAILKYANVDRKEKPKQTLPVWADLVKDCKDAMKTITISAKTGASPFWSKAGLAGIDIIKWYVAFMDTRGFKNLDDAKKFVRALSAQNKKYLAHEKSYIYRATNNKMDRIVDFSIQKDGKVRFRKIASA